MVFSVLFWFFEVFGCFGLYFVFFWCSVLVIGTFWVFVVGFPFWMMCSVVVVVLEHFYSCFVVVSELCSGFIVA